MESQKKHIKIDYLILYLSIPTTRSMESYLCSDIANIILLYLDKNSSFHFLNATKQFHQFKKSLYEKYLFNHDIITNYQIAPHIKHLKSTNIPNIKYPNLISLSINPPYNKSSFLNFVKLPKTLQSLKIKSVDFKIFGRLPDTLQSLEIDNQCGAIPNKFLDRLPSNLKSLKIDSNNPPIEKLPNGLINLELTNCKRSFHNLPISLQHLKIVYIYKNDGSINHLPNGLQSVDIGYYDQNIAITKLPLKLASLSLICFDYSKILNNLPNTLKILQIPWGGFHGKFDNLPKSLEIIKISRFCSEPLDYIPKNIDILFI